MSVSSRQQSQPGTLLRQARAGFGRAAAPGKGWPGVGRDISHWQAFQGLRRQPPSPYQAPLLYRARRVWHCMTHRQYNVEHAWVHGSERWGGGRDASQTPA